MLSSLTRFAVDRHPSLRLSDAPRRWSRNVHLRTCLASHQQLAFALAADHAFLSCVSWPPAAGPLSWVNLKTMTPYHHVSPIPDIVRGLDAIAVALLSREGVLWDANRGFLTLLRGTELNGEHVDIRPVFANPTFDHLLTRTPDPVEGVVFRGVLTLTDASGRVTPVRGVVFTHDADLLLVAEHDIGEIMTLRSKLLTALDEIDTRDREIIQLRREVEQARTLAAAALRDRDALLDTLTRGPAHLPSHD